MAGFAPIVRNVYIDPFEQKKESIPSYYLWEVFLYEHIIKGNKPVFKIICSDRDKLMQKRDEIIERFNVVSLYPVCRNHDKEDIAPFDEPIVTDLITGEIIE